LSYIEQDYFEKSQNYFSTGAKRAEINIHLEDPVSAKTVRRDMSFTNSTSTAGLQLLNLWLLKVMLRCVNDGVTTLKLEHQTSTKRERDMVR
jgi:hypothetical protein